MNTIVPEQVSDKTYTIEGREYHRVTSVIDATIGGQSVEAAACEVSKHASELFDAHNNGVVLQKPVRLWDGSKFVEAFEDLLPSDCLSDPKRLQGYYYRVRQGWLDRGTILNCLFDQLANGMEPTPGNAAGYVHNAFEEGKTVPGSTNPVPWQCDAQDVTDRAMWMARFFRSEKPIVTHVQVTVKSDRLGVAGTLDGIGVHDDRPCVWEVKAGSEQFSHQVQSGTYKNLAVGSKNWGVVALYVKRDGYRLVSFTKEQIRDGYQAFKSVLPAYLQTRIRRDWNTSAQDSDKKLERRTA